MQNRFYLQGKVTFHSFQNIDLAPFLSSIDLTDLLTDTRVLMYDETGEDEFYLIEDPLPDLETLDIVYKYYFFRRVSEGNFTNLIFSSIESLTEEEVNQSITQMYHDLYRENKAHTDDNKCEKINPN